MLLDNGTLRHIIVFFQILYFLEKFVNVECLNKKRGKHTVKKEGKKKFTKVILESLLSHNLCMTICG